MFKAQKRQQGRGVARDDRKFQILTMLYESAVQFRSRVQRDPETPMFHEKTVTDIAHKLGMKPSHQIRLMLAELVSEGVVNVREEHHRNNAFRRIYTIQDFAIVRSRWFERFESYYGGYNG